MEHKKYNLSVEIQATNVQKAQKDIQQVADTVRKTGDEAQKAGRAVSGSLGSAVRETGDKAKTTSRVVSSSLGSAFRVAGSAVKEFASASVASLKKVGSAAMSLGRGIKTGLLAPLSLVRKGFGLLKGVAIGAAAGVISAWLQVKGVLAALGPASDMQQYQIQMEVLLKDADKASKRMEELKRYAKTTNYSPQQVIQAANLMQSFGIYTFKRLQILGDVANAFGRDISEIVTSVNYLASGRSGEALESLSRFGVTRQKLTEAGMKFAKNGSLITESKQAVDILFRYMEKQFGGMTARQAQTWKGAMTIAGGQWWDSMARGFNKVLKPMTDFVNSRITPVFEAIGNRLESIDWGKKLEKPLAMLGGFAELIRMITDPSSSQAGMERLNTLKNDLINVFKASGSFLYSSIIAGGKFFVELLKTAWGLMSERFRSDLMSSLPSVFGYYEKNKRDWATNRTFAELFPQMAQQIADNPKYQIDQRTQQMVPAGSSVHLENQRRAMNEYVKGLSPARQKQWEETYARNMGWRAYQAPESGDFMAALSKFTGNFTQLNQEATARQEQEAARNQQSEKLNRTYQNLGQSNLRDLMDLRRMAMYYRQKGWTSSGRALTGREEARGMYMGARQQWQDIWQGLTPEEQQQYRQMLRGPVRRQMPSLAVTSSSSARTPSSSALIPDVRRTRGASFSTPVAAVMEEEKERRKRRTSRNNGLGSGHAITGGRHDAVLRRRGKTRGDVQEETAPQGGRSRGSSGKSVESAIEKGFQRGFERLEAKIGRRIFVVV